MRFKYPLVPAAGDMLPVVSKRKRITNSDVDTIFIKTYTCLEAPRASPNPKIYALHGQCFKQVEILLNITGSLPEHIDTVLERDIK